MEVEISSFPFVVQCCCRVGLKSGTVSNGTSYYFNGGSNGVLVPTFI